MLNLDHDLGNSVKLKDVLLSLHHYVYPGGYENRPTDKEIRDNAIDILNKLEYPRVNAGKTEW